VAKNRSIRQQQQLQNKEPVLATKRGPTSTKRQRERARKEWQDEKARRRAQRQAQRDGVDAARDVEGEASHVPGKPEDPGAP
jgi:hypothetical protein